MEFRHSTNQRERLFGGQWRRERDSNPRYGFPHTHFPGVRLQPLELGADAPDKVKATVMALFCRVEIRSDRVDITLSRGRLTQLLAGSLDLKMQHQAPTSASDDLLGLTVPVGLKRVGCEFATK